MANIPRGMGGMGGLGNPGMASMLQNLQKKLMEDAEKMQQRLTETKIEGSSGGGAVKAVVNGHGMVVEVVISPEVVDPSDVEMLQDLISTAFREAQEKAEDLRTKEQEKLMPGNIPGIGNLSGLF